jgi:Family of unknown function (DUF5678)
MAARDWTKLYKQYQGQWVALGDDEQTVIAAASTLREVMKTATRLGYASPHVVKLPHDLRIFVG